MMEADPSLTTPALMAAIRQGATDGGTTAGGFRIRMWVDGTRVAVQRGAGVELITPAVAPASLNVIHFHGGQRLDVEYYDNGLQDALTFQELMIQKDLLNGTCELDFVGASDGLVRFSTIVTPDVPGLNPSCGDLRGGFSAAVARTTIVR